MGIFFRAARAGEPAELAALARLSGELGYPVEPEQVAARLAGIAGDRDGALLVAEEDGGRVVGWIQVQSLTSLTGGRVALIAGLVVAEGERGRGVGAGLVAAAEEWARERGLARMVVRSRDSRARAHSFYERLGYTKEKTQLVFGKGL